MKTPLFYAVACALTIGFTSALLHLNTGIVSSQRPASKKEIKDASDAGRCAAGKCAPKEESAAPSSLKGAAKGDPGVKSIECMAFGPKGLLLIGDGAGAQLVALETADTKHLGEFKKVTGLNAKLAAKFGLKASDIAITAYTANRESGCAYFALRRHDGRGVMIAQVKPDGAMEEVPLKGVSYAAITLPKQDGGGAVKFNSVLWTDRQVIASATNDDAFTARVFSVEVPIAHGVQGTMVVANSYHVTHGGWETTAPLEKIALWSDGADSYLVAGLSCTPVVKYALKDIKAGAQLKGSTPFDFGGGQQPIDLFTHEGWLYCCVEGWEAPYIVRVAPELMRGQKGTDKAAPTVTDDNSDSNAIRKEFSGVVKAVPGVGAKPAGIMQLSGSHMLVLHEGKNDLDLEAVALPKK